MFPALWDKKNNISIVDTKNFQKSKLLKSRYTSFTNTIFLKTTKIFFSSLDNPPLHCWLVYAPLSPTYAEKTSARIPLFGIPIFIEIIKPPPKSNRTSENFGFFWFPESHCYFDGPYGPSCTSMQLCCFEKKSNFFNCHTKFLILDEVAKCRAKKRQKTKPSNTTSTLYN